MARTWYLAGRPQTRSFEELTCRDCFSNYTILLCGSHRAGRRRLVVASIQTHLGNQNTAFLLGRHHGFFS